MFRQEILIGISMLLGLVTSSPQFHPSLSLRHSISNNATTAIAGLATDLSNAAAGGSNSTSSTVITSAETSSVTTDSTTTNSTASIQTATSSQTETTACTEPSPSVPGEFSLAFMCKSCNFSTDVYSRGAPDSFSAWQAADANDALGQSLAWFNEAATNVAENCTYAEETCCTSQPYSPVAGWQSYISGI